jgi:hypothetical protein
MYNRILMVSVVIPQSYISRLVRHDSSLQSDVHKLFLLFVAPCRCIPFQVKGISVKLRWPHWRLLESTGFMILQDLQEGTELSVLAPCSDTRNILAGQGMCQNSSVRSPCYLVASS